MLFRIPTKENVLADQQLKVYILFWEASQELESQREI